MNDLLKAQYRLIKSSRQVVFDFIESQVGTEFTLPLKEFNGVSLRYLLIHIANTYYQLLSEFALKKNIEYANEANFHSIEQIRTLFEQMDTMVNLFLHSFDGLIQEPVHGIVSGHALELSRLQLFTHVLTHEFHHKGQLMSMCRILGHIPPDTDVIRF